MRDPERIDRICEKLNKLWHKVPDQRLGQLLENYVFGHYMFRRRLMFFIEDEEAEENLDKFMGDSE